MLLFCKFELKVKYNFGFKLFQVTNLSVEIFYLKILNGEEKICTMKNQYLFQDWFYRKISQRASGSGEVDMCQKYVNGLAFIPEQ